MRMPYRYHTYPTWSSHSVIILWASDMIHYMEVDIFFSYYRSKWSSHMLNNVDIILQTHIPINLWLTHSNPIWGFNECLQGSLQFIVIKRMESYDLTIKFINQFLRRFADFLSAFLELFKHFRLIFPFLYVPNQPLLMFRIVTLVLNCGRFLKC